MNRKLYNYLVKTYKFNKKMLVVISKCPYLSYKYTIDIVKGRFILGEEAISKDAQYSYLYSYYIIKGRFELGEEEISKYENWSYYYARDVIKGRFELGEEAISKDDFYYNNYQKILRKHGQKT